MHSSTYRPSSKGSVERDATVVEEGSQTPASVSASGHHRPRFRTSQAAVETRQLLEAIQEIDLHAELRYFLIRESIIHASARSNAGKSTEYSSYSPRSEGPVRLEMMKALARKWKLHFQPGFWRKHENRRDLMYALIAHGRQLYRKDKGDPVLREVPRKPPTEPLGAQTLRLPSIRPVIRPDMHDSRFKPQQPPTPPSVEYEPLHAPVFQRTTPLLLPYKGDIFGTQGDYSDALLYRSRHGVQKPAPGNVSHLQQSPFLSKSVTFSPDTLRTPQMAPNGALEGGALSDHIEPSDAPNASPRTELMPSSSEMVRHELNLRHQAAKALRDLSRNPLNRLEIVAEGAHVALLEVLDENNTDEAIKDCSVAFAYLSAIQPPNAPAALVNDQKKWVALRRAARARLGVAESRGLSHRPSLSQLLSGMSGRAASPRAGSFAGGSSFWNMKGAATSAEDFWAASGSCGRHFWPEAEALYVYVDSVEFNHAGKYLYAEPSLYRGVVSALHDIAVNAAPSTRVVVATCLYNMSCNCSYWPALVEERAVDALLYCLKNVEVDVANVPDEVIEKALESSNTPSPLHLHEMTSSALLLELSIRALCNLSNDRRAARQIAEQKAFQIIASQWHYLRWELQNAIIAYLAYNLSAHVYTAESCVSQGVLSLLRHVVLQLETPSTEFEVWLLTRIICIFANLTVTPKLSRVLLREQGGEPFQRALSLLQSVIDEEEGSREGVALSQLAHREITHCMRSAAEALSRMLWANMSDAAAGQGLCGPLASLLLSQHDETRHAAALAVCNLVRSPEASVIAANDGVIASLVRLVLTKTSGASPLPVIAMAFYNTSCYEHGCLSLLTLQNVDVGVGSSSDSTRNLLPASDIPGSDANMPAASALILLIQRELARLADMDASTFPASAAIAAEWSPLVDGSTAPFAATESFRVISFAIATLRNLSSVSNRWAAPLVASGAAALALRFLALPGAAEVLSRRSGRGAGGSTGPAPSSWRYTPLAQMPVQVLGDAVHVLANLTVDAALRQEMIRQGALEALSPLGRSLRSSVLEAARQLSCLLIKEKVEARAAQYAAQVVARRRDEEDDADKGGVAEGNARTPGAAAGPKADATPGPQQGKGAGGQQQKKEEEAARTRRSSIRKVLQEQKRAALMAEEKARQLSKAKEDMHAERETQRVQRTFDSAAAVSSLALSNLACDADPDIICDARYEVIPTLVSLLKASEDGDVVRPRVVAALNQLSRNAAIAKLMIAGGVIEAIVPVCVSEEEDVRRNCVGVLYNLSIHHGSEAIMANSDVVKALNVMALIRTHDAHTQARAVDTLYNIMTDPGVRITVLQQGVIWMLQKLSLSVNTETQRACAVSLYRLSCDSRAQSMLVREGGIRSVISVLLAYFRNRRSALTAAQAPLSRRAGPGSEEAEEEEEGLRFLMSPRLAQPTDEVGAADGLVAALFAGILSVVSRKKGNEELLVREGAVEALVMLASQAQGTAGPGFNAMRSGSAASEAPLLNSSSMAHRRYGNVLASIDGGAASPDVNALRSSCAEGLCNLTQSPKSEIRDTVLNGGACDVFVSVGTAREETMRTRRLCLLGTVNLLWGTPNPPVSMEGINALLESVILTGDWKDRYACTIVLHSPFFRAEKTAVPRVLYLLLHLLVKAFAKELSSDSAELLVSYKVPKEWEGAVNAAHDANDDFIESCSLMEETLMLLIAAALPFTLNEASAEDFAQHDGIALLCTVIRLLLYRTRTSNAHSAGAPVFTSHLHHLRAWAVTETLSIFASALAILSTSESNGRRIIDANGTTVLSDLIASGPTDAVRARAMVAVRNITAWPNLRAPILERDGHELLSRIVKTITTKRRGDTSLLAFGELFIDHNAISTSGLWKFARTHEAAAASSPAEAIHVVTELADLGASGAMSNDAGSSDSDDHDEPSKGGMNASAILGVTASESLQQAIKLFPMQADAGKCLCNLTRESRAFRAVLTKADTASGLITISDHPDCSPSLRHACLQALCELTIDEERVSSGDGDESVDDLKASSGQVTALIAVINAKREKEMHLAENDAEADGMQDWCIGQDDPIASTSMLPTPGSLRLFPDTREQGLKDEGKAFSPQDFRKRTVKTTKLAEAEEESMIAARPALLTHILNPSTAADAADAAQEGGSSRSSSGTAAPPGSDVWPKIEDHDEAVLVGHSVSAVSAVSRADEDGVGDDGAVPSPGPIPTLSRGQSFAEANASRQAAVKAASARKHKRVRRGSVLSVEVAPVLDAASVASSASDASKLTSPPPGASGPFLHASSSGKPGKGSLASGSGALYSITETKDKGSLFQPERQLAGSVQVMPSPNAWWKNKDEKGDEHDGMSGTLTPEGLVGVFISFPTVVEPEAVLALQRNTENFLSTAFREPSFTEALHSVSHYGGELRTRIARILHQKELGQDAAVDEHAMVDNLLTAAWESDAALKGQVSDGSKTYFRRLSLTVYQPQASPVSQPQHSVSLLRSGLGTGAGVLPNTFAMRSPWSASSPAPEWPSYHLFRLVNAGEVAFSQLSPPSAASGGHDTSDSSSIPLSKWVLRTHGLVPGIASSLYNFIALRVLGFSPKLLAEGSRMDDEIGFEPEPGLFRETATASNSGRASEAGELKRQLLAQHQDELLKASERDDAAPRTTSRNSIVYSAASGSRTLRSPLPRPDTQLSSHTASSRPASQQWDKNQEEELIKEVVRTRRSSHAHILGPTILFLPHEEGAPVDALIDSLPPVAQKKHLVWQQQPSESDDGSARIEEKRQSRWHVGVFTQTEAPKKARKRSPRRGKKISTKALAQSERLYHNRSRQGSEAEALKGAIPSLEPHPPMSPIRGTQASPRPRHLRQHRHLRQGTEEGQRPSPRRVSSNVIHSVKQSPYNANKPLTAKAERAKSRGPKQLW